VPGADRINASTTHLRENVHRAPVLVLPVFGGRMEGANTFQQASMWGSIIQAIWSFMLALRVRGLGSAWTTGHLWKEKEMAALLGIPGHNYTQGGPLPGRPHPGHGVQACSSQTRLRGGELEPLLSFPRIAGGPAAH
jgi:hypothetical protein